MWLVTLDSFVCVCLSVGDGSIGEDEFVAVNAMGDVTADDCKAAFKKLTSVSFISSLESHSIVYMNGLA